VLPLTALLRILSINNWCQLLSMLPYQSRTSKTCCNISGQLPGQSLFYLVHLIVNVTSPKQLDIDIAMIMSALVTRQLADQLQESKYSVLSQCFLYYEIVNTILAPGLINCCKMSSVITAS